MTDSSRARDGRSGQLGTLCSSWRDIQQTRLALQQRGFDDAAGALHKVEASFGRQVTRELRRHALWPWLSEHPGVRGVHVASLIAIIGDPTRFPGQGCSEGHAFTPLYLVGDQCPFLLGTDERRCEGIVVARAGSGTRSLWRYLGLDVVDGRSPRKRKGRQGHWHMAGRAHVLQPGGIAEQIVRLNVEPWVGIYRATKARLTETRAASPGEAAQAISPSLIDGAEAEPRGEVEAQAGLRPIQIDQIARKVAAKAFVADLLTEWKRRVVEHADGVDDEGGGAPRNHADGGPLGSGAGVAEAGETVDLDALRRDANEILSGVETYLAFEAGYAALVERIATAEEPELSRLLTLKRQIDQVREEAA